ncbi:MAG: tandem-95 repeat protein [Salinibacterium sp.]|nr:tandem-95 repeat protein [Salinibacterium sp.]
MDSHARLRTRLALVAVAVLTVVGASSTIAPPTATDEASAAGSNLSCDQNTLYGITSAGDVIEIDATTGAATAVSGMAPATNGLGITYNGTSAWAFESGANTIVAYDPVTGVSTTIAAPDPEGNQVAIRGAVNPVNNIYYYAGSGTSARIAGYDITNGTPIGQVGTITGLGGNNGDMAFGTDGTLYVVDGDKVYQVGSVPSVAGVGNLPASQILTLPGGSNSPGIAYSSDGYLFLAASSASATIYKINPSSGANVATLTISTAQPVVDLATCNYANSLRGEVDVRSRAASTDQFTLTNSGGGISSGNTATTTGTSVGLQSAVAGPNLTLGGDNYSVTQTASGTTDLSKYSVGWTCVNLTTSLQVAKGTGNTASFTNPMTVTSQGTDVVCTFLTAVLPLAVDDAYTTPINTTLTVNAAAGLLANDTGADITVTANTAPTNGGVTVSADGSLSYVPDSGFTGTDTFDYTITDANGTTSSATATIQVQPVAADDSYSTPADTPLTISDLTANDTPTTMTVQSVTTPTHGAAVLNGDGTVTYTPTAGYTGPDTFDYTAIDTNGQTATATVTITVAAMAANDQATGTPNTPTILRPLTNDTPTGGSTFDPATLRIFDPATSSWVTDVTISAVGNWKIVGSELHFTPVSGFTGTASIPYRVTDTASNTVTANASVFYPTLALAYTNVEHAKVGVTLSVASVAFLIGLLMLLFAAFQRRTTTRRTPRHRGATP